MSKDASACTREFRRIYYHQQGTAKCGCEMYECFSSVPLCAGVGSLRGIVLYETQQKDDNITTIMKKSGLAFRVTAVSSRPVGRHP